MVASRRPATSSACPTTPTRCSPSPRPTDCSFYEGELAGKIDAAARAQGGLLRKADLAAHEYDHPRTVHTDYKGLTLHEIPPNGQGITACIALGILRHFDLTKFEPDDPACLHLQIEAMKLAFRDAHRYIADPAFMDTTNDALLDPDYLAARAKLIDPEPRAPTSTTAPPSRAGPSTSPPPTPTATWSPTSSPTTPGSAPGSSSRAPASPCRTAAAASRSRTATPTRPGPPSAPTTPSSRASSPAKRATGNDEPVMSFGVMGGYMQPQGHAQVMVRLADFNQNPQAALDAPRWQVTEGLTVTIEPGFDDSVYTALESMGHDVQRARARTVSHGRGQIIRRMDPSDASKGYVAASDQRADGQAVGY
jgi:gamma-glutamyltranspeptidase/glutathione hydrolase